MGAGTAFTTTVNGTSYQFVTIADVTGTNTGNSVPFDNTVIYEGTYVTSKYLVDTSDIDQRFILNSPRVDTTTLTVKVQTSADDTSTTNGQRICDKKPKKNFIKQNIQKVQEQQMNRA